MLKTTTLMSKYKSTGKQKLFDAEIAIGVHSGIGTEEARQLDRLRGLPQSAGIGDGEPQYQEQCRSEAVRCGDDVQSDAFTPLLHYNRNLHVIEPLRDTTKLAKRLR